MHMCVEFSLQGARPRVGVSSSEIWGDDLTLRNHVRKFSIYLNFISVLGDFFLRGVLFYIFFFCSCGWGLLTCLVFFLVFFAFIFVWFLSAFVWFLVFFGVGYLGFYFLFLFLGVFEFFVFYCFALFICLFFVLFCFLLFVFGGGAFVSLFLFLWRSFLNESHNRKITWNCKKNHPYLESYFGFRFR